MPTATPFEDKSELSADERRVLYLVAEAVGFDEEFGDLLCELAERLGFERVATGLGEGIARRRGPSPAPFR